MVLIFFFVLPDFLSHIRSSVMQKSGGFQLPLPRSKFSVDSQVSRLASQAVMVKQPAQRSSKNSSKRSLVRRESNGEVTMECRGWIYSPRANESPSRSARRQVGRGASI